MNTLLLRLLCFVIGYAFGCIQWAYLIGRMKGIDIRTQGSGNSGTTNAMRVMGKKTGYIVFLLDFGKSIVCLLLIGLLFGSSNPETIYLLKMWAFAGIVLGHDFPFYMQFRGGKGVAVIAGFVFGFHISLLPIAVCAFFIPFFLTHYVSLGSLCVYTIVCLSVIIEGALGLYHLASFGMLIEISAIMILLTCLAWYQHRKNIGRLRSGTESRMYLTKK